MRERKYTRLPRHTMGVYAIINRTRGRIYIGATQDVPRRWMQHRSELRRHIHKTTALQQDWDRDGAAAFAFVLLQFVHEHAELRVAERQWMERYHDTRPGDLYNTWLPSRRQRLSDSSEEYFAANICQRATGCWEWQGKGSKLLLPSNGRQIMAYRWAYNQFRGKVAPGDTMRRTCDNPRCVNPHHYRLIPAAERVAQMLRQRHLRPAGTIPTHCGRGHELVGDNLMLEGNGTQWRCRTCRRSEPSRRGHSPREYSNLTPDEVRAMRRLHDEGVSVDQLSTRFGRTKHHVYRIVTRRSWRQLT